MKIIEARTWVENLELTRPYTIAYQTYDSVENIFVELKTDTGLTGVGIASPAEEVTGEGISQCKTALETRLEQLVVGEDIRCINRILRNIETEMPAAPSAAAAIDIALHDLWGRYLGLPLAELFGRCHDSLPTSITIGIKPVDETVEEALEYKGRGFHILKVKIGISLDEDIERLYKIREKLGREILIRVDANQGYSLDEYRKFIEKTAAVDLEFIEQPLVAGDMDGMRSLPENIRKITAADESLLDVCDALTCLEHPKPFGIFNIKLMKCGGVAPGMKIADIARYAGIDLMWGCMDESIVGIAAALHAALASPATRYLDLDGSLDLARDLVEGGFILEDGRLRLNDQPGLGVNTK